MRKRFAGRPLEHQSQERRICLAYECTKSCEQKLSDIGWKVIHLLALYPIAEATIVVCAKQTQPLMRRYGRQMSLRKSCLKEKSPASGRGLVEDTMEMTGRGCLSDRPVSCRSPISVPTASAAKAAAAEECTRPKLYQLTRSLAEKGVMNP